MVIIDYGLVVIKNGYGIVNEILIKIKRVLIKGLF